MNRRALYWLPAFCIYWCFAVKVLMHVSPISIDNYGPGSSFYWGTRILAPTLREYDENWSVQRQFLLPHFAAASVLTIQGCGIAGFLLLEIRANIRRPMLASFILCLVLMLSSAAISDVGTKLRWWRGPIMFADVLSLIAVLKIVIPLSCLSALIVGFQAVWQSGSGSQRPETGGLTRQDRLNAGLCKLKFCATRLGG
jgi:hypothetical protein